MIRAAPEDQAEDQARALHRAIRDASETRHVRDRTVAGCTRTVLTQDYKIWKSRNVLNTVLTQDSYDSYTWSA